MKLKMTVVVVLGLMLTGVGCARFLGVDSKTEFGGGKKAHSIAPKLSPGQAQAYDRWKVIDTDKLSVNQRKTLKNAKEPRTELERAQNEWFIAHYPWIDSSDLSLRDKVFLADESHGFVETLLR